MGCALEDSSRAWNNMLTRPGMHACGAETLRDDRSTQNLTHPFKDQRCSGFDGLTIQIPPLCTIHFRPKVRMQVPIEVIFQDGGEGNHRNTVGSTKAPVTATEKMRGEKAAFIMTPTNQFHCGAATKGTGLYYSHAASSITNPLSWTHPRTPRGQNNIIDSPRICSCGVVGLDPSEPCSGRTTKQTSRTKQKQKSNQTKHKTPLAW